MLSTPPGERQADALRKAMTVESPVDGTPLFDSVQATWNLLETSCGGQRLCLGTPVRSVGATQLILWEKSS